MCPQGRILIVQQTLYSTNRVKNKSKYSDTTGLQAEIQAENYTKLSAERHEFSYNVILSVVVSYVLPQGPDDDHTQNTCIKEKQCYQRVAENNIRRHARLYIYALSF